MKFSHENSAFILCVAHQALIPSPNISQVLYPERARVTGLLSYVEIYILSEWFKFWFKTKTYLLLCAFNYNIFTSIVNCAVWHNVA